MSGPSFQEASGAPSPPPSNGTEGDKPITDAYRDLVLRLGEVREYIAHFVSAKVDAAKASARNIALLAVLGIVGAVALVALTATAVVLLLSGISTGLGLLFGGAMWLGELVAGLLFLVLLAGGGLVALGIVKKASLKRTIRKYEDRQERQRIHFGRDASDQARAARAAAGR